MLPPAVIEATCDPERAKVKFTYGKCDEKQLNYYYNLADAQFMMTDNEGWGLGLTLVKRIVKEYHQNVCGFCLLG